MLAMVKNVVHNLLTRPATRTAARAPFAAARGHLVNDIDNCIFCGMCQRQCPAKAITVDRAAKDWTLDPFACVICGACVAGCPKKCLHLAGEWRPSATAHTSETMHQAPKVAAD